MATAELKIHDMPSGSSQMAKRPEGMSIGGTIYWPLWKMAENSASYLTL